MPIFAAQANQGDPATALTGGRQLSAAGRKLCSCAAAMQLQRPEHPWGLSGVAAYIRTHDYGTKLRYSLTGIGISSMELTSNSKARQPPQLPQNARSGSRTLAEDARDTSMEPAPPRYERRRSTPFSPFRRPRRCPSCGTTVRATFYLLACVHSLHSACGCIERTRRSRSGMNSDPCASTKTNSRSVSIIYRRHPKNLNLRPTHSMSINTHTPPRGS